LLPIATIIAGLAAGWISADIGEAEQHAYSIFSLPPAKRRGEEKGVLA
jgi:hypothetical protein